MIEIIELIGTLIPLLYLQGCLDDDNDICPEQCCNGNIADIYGVCCPPEYLSCEGICYGQAVVDKYGECCWPIYLDCTGVCGGGYDDAVLDKNGVCCNWNFLDSNNVCCDIEVDCLGVCGGTCDKCDCLGVCNGNAVQDINYDDYFPATSEYNEGTCCIPDELDCLGVCNGNAVQDENGGCCNGEFLDSNNICCDIEVDCLGICGGDTVCEIKNVKELLAIKTFDNYILTKDIDFADATINPLLPDGYSGIFDGNGFEIKNFTIDLPETDNVGLFAENNGTIKNLGISGNCSISGASNVGGLIGYNNGGTLLNCYNAMTGDINGGIEDCSDECIVQFQNVGGLVGRNGGLVGKNYRGITNCYNAMTGNITGFYYVGGLMGSSNYYSITNCYNNMTGNITGYSTVGGLVGWAVSRSLENCYNSMTGDINSNDVSGGLLAETISVIILNCYNVMNGNINATNSTSGGLVGDLGTASSCGTPPLFGCPPSVLLNCYNAMTGNITSNGSVGGIVAQNFRSIISNCYNAIEGSISDTDESGVILGYNSNTAPGFVDNYYNAMDGWNDSDAFNESNEALTNINNGWNYLYYYDYNDELENDNNVWYDFDQNPQTTNIPYGLVVFTKSPWIGYNSHDSKPTLE